MVVIYRALVTYCRQAREFYLEDRKFKIYFLGIRLSEYGCEKYDLKLKANLINLCIVSSLEYILRV